MHLFKMFSLDMLEDRFVGITCFAKVVYKCVKRCGGGAWTLDVD
jgi:hypothetical protein